jgi:hypothetical protein
MKPSIRNTLLLLPLLGAVAVVAWQVRLTLWAMFPPPGLACIAPSWFVTRAALTALAVYPALLLQPLRSGAVRVVVGVIGLIMLGVSFTYPLFGTGWGLPAFVGVHFALALWFAVRAFLRLLSPTADAYARRA